MRRSPAEDAQIKPTSCFRASMALRFIDTLSFAKPSGSLDRPRDALRERKCIKTERQRQISFSGDRCSNKKIGTIDWTPSEVSAFVHRKALRPCIETALRGCASKLHIRFVSLRPVCCRVIGLTIRLFQAAQRSPQCLPRNGLNSPKHTASLEGIFCPLTPKP